MRGKKGASSAFSALSALALAATLATACTGAAANRQPQTEGEQIGFAPVLHVGTDVYTASERMGRAIVYRRTIAPADVRNATAYPEEEAEFFVGDDNLTSLTIEDNDRAVYSRTFGGDAYVIGSAELKLATGKEHFLEAVAIDADGNRSYASIRIAADGKVSGVVEPPASGKTAVVAALGGPYSLDENIAAEGVRGVFHADMPPNLESVEVPAEKVAQGAFVINAYVLGGDEPVPLFYELRDPASGKVVDRQVSDPDDPTPLQAYGEDLPAYRRIIIYLKPEDVFRGGMIEGLDVRAGVASEDGAQSQAYDGLVVRLPKE